MTDTPPAVRLEPEQLDAMRERDAHWDVTTHDVPLPHMSIKPRYEVVSAREWGVHDRRLLLSHTAALESELVEAKAKVEWRPIETAPRDGTRVMLGWPGGGVRYGFYLNNTNWKGWRGPSMELPFPSPPPTHWMPLPAPPKDAALRDGTKGEL